jgi:hypothetical protein
MRASLRWLLLCLLGRSALASHTLGLAISQVSCKFETLEGWVLYIQEAHFLSSSGLTHLRGPFLIIIGSYSLARPISIIIGSYSFTRPISSSSGLTPSCGPFHHHRVLLLHEAYFYQCRDLLLHAAHFYHHWVLLLYEAHFIIIGSYSFMRPISNDSFEFFQFFS